MQDCDKIGRAGKWDAEQVIVVRGAPGEPVQRKTDRRVFVAIGHRGNGVQPMEDEDDMQDQPQQHDEEEETFMQFR